MSDRSSIEWTDASWNPIRALAGRPDGTVRFGWHCEHKSEGCRNCYAEAFNRRLGTGFDYKPGHIRPTKRPHPSDPPVPAEVSVFLDDKALLRPLKWRKPRKIFVCSMTDLFADFVTDEMIDRAFAVMALCPQHVFQVLTKRPERMREYLRASDRNTNGHIMALAEELKPSHLWNGNVYQAHHELAAHGFLPNVWLGVSVEDQAAADERIPHLLASPAAVRWLSCEPLLGPIEWKDEYRQQARDLSGSFRRSQAAIDWIVVGGESGPGARPMHPDWARALRDQCAEDHVAFLFKQWGAWAPVVDDADIRHTRQWVLPPNAPVMLPGEPREYRGCLMHRCGKKEAGRLLDGVQHDGYPS